MATNSILSGLVSIRGTMKNRRGTALEWTALNPVLANAEIGVETDTLYFKIGDGVRDWNSLPYSQGDFIGVISVNGQQGIVVLTAADVGALTPEELDEKVFDSGVLESLDPDAPYPRWKHRRTFNGTVATSADLERGELYISFPDGVLYSKDSADNVVQVAVAFKDYATAARAGLVKIESGSGLTLGTEGALSANVRSVQGKTGDVTLNADEIGAISALLLGQPNGVATLDGAGKVPIGQIPNGNVYTVNSQAGMLALAQAQRGDIARRTDNNTNWICLGTDNSQLSGWADILFPTVSVPVTSVLGKVGDVTFDISEVPNVAQVAISNQYSDLDGLPDLDALTGPPATTSSLGSVVVGAGLNITTGGTLSTQIQTVNGKNDQNIILTAEDIGALDATTIGAQGGVAGPLDEDPDEDPDDPILSDYQYGRLLEDQLPMSGWFTAGTWNPLNGVTTRTISLSGGYTATVRLKDGGLLQLDWNDGTDEQTLDVPADTGVYVVSGNPSGSTVTLDGVTDWGPGDLAVAVNGAWRRISTQPLMDSWVDLTLSSGATAPLNGFPEHLLDFTSTTVLVRVQDDVDPDKWYDASGVATVTYDESGNWSLTNNDPTRTLNFRYRYVRL